MAAFSLIEGYRRTGDRHIAHGILACMLAKIGADVVQRALELAGVRFIDVDDSGGEGVRLPAQGYKQARRRCVGSARRRSLTTA